jgi:hypothetical protein
MLRPTSQWKHTKELAEKNLVHQLVNSMAPSEIYRLLPSIALHVTGGQGAGRVKPDLVHFDGSFLYRQARRRDVLVRPVCQISAARRR